MSTAVMTERIAETSPRFGASGLRAQTAGVIYLLSVLAATFAEIFVGGKLDVAGGPHGRFGHDRRDAVVL